MIVEVYYTFVLAYSAWSIYNRTNRIINVLIATILDLPIIGRVFGVW